MSYSGLLLFSIGPVQEFIASARTGRDLWTGSYLLSYLSQKAQSAATQSAALAKPFYPLYPHPPAAGAGGAKPPLANQVDQLPPALFPNKFSLLVDYTQAEKVAGKAQQAVESEWQTI